MKGRNLMHSLTKAYDETLMNFDVLIMPTMLKTAKRNPNSNITPKGETNLIYSYHVNTVSSQDNGVNYLGKVRPYRL